MGECVCRLLAEAAGTQKRSSVQIMVKVVINEDASQISEP